MESAQELKALAPVLTHPSPKTLAACRKVAVYSDGGSPGHSQENQVPTDATIWGDSGTGSSVSSSVKWEEQPLNCPLLCFSEVLLLSEISA